MTRFSSFTKPLRVWVSPAQDTLLADEVKRRQDARKMGEIVEASPLPLAHGGNRNINRGTLIREAIEKTYGPSEAAA